MTTGAARGPVLRRALLVLALVAGIVAMHHVAGTGGCHADAGTSSMAGMSMPAPAAHHVTPAVPAGPVASAVVPTGADDPCLAVLAAAVLTAVLGGVAVAVAPVGARLAGRVRRREGPSRAPPVPRRLAALGVLRL